MFPNLLRYWHKFLSQLLLARNYWKDTHQLFCVTLNLFGHKARRVYVLLSFSHNVINMETRFTSQFPVLTEASIKIEVPTSPFLEISAFWKAHKQLMNVCCTHRVDADIPRVFHNLFCNERRKCLSVYKCLNNVKHWDMSCILLYKSAHVNLEAADERFMFIF